MERPPRQSNSRVRTLDEAARPTGVARAAAPRAIGGSAHVTAGSRQAVRQAVPNLDFATARSAARSRARANDTIAVVITETTNRIFGDPFFSPLLQGIYDATAERSLLMAILAPQSAKDLELAEAYIIKHIDGAILVSIHGNNPLPTRLRENGVATVMCGRPAKGIIASSVDSNNRQGAVLAVEHLIGLGRRTIATISGNLDMAGASDRLMGYRDALAAAGMSLDPTLEEVADYLPDRAQMAMERLLLNHPEVDAVFAASDLMAAAAIRVLQQARKRIPEDVAIVGFDDSPTARATCPPLTSIRQPIDEIGHEVVNILMRELHEPQGAPREVVFTTELVVRESTIGAVGEVPSIPMGG